MELMDIFAKFDIQLDNSCKRNEKIYRDMCKEIDDREPNLFIEKESINRRGAAEKIPLD